MHRRIVTITGSLPLWTGDWEQEPYALAHMCRRHCDSESREEEKYPRGDTCGIWGQTNRTIISGAFSTFPFLFSRSGCTVLEPLRLQRRVRERARLGGYS